MSKVKCYLNYSRLKVSGFLIHINNMNLPSGNRWWSCSFLTFRHRDPPHPSPTSPTWLPRSCDTILWSRHRDDAETSEMNGFTNDSWKVNSYYWSQLLFCKDPSKTNLDGWYNSNYSRHINSHTYIEGSKYNLVTFRLHEDKATCIWVNLICMVHPSVKLISIYTRHLCYHVFWILSDVNIENIAYEQWFVWINNYFLLCMKCSVHCAIRLIIKKVLLVRLIDALYKKD